MKGPEKNEAPAETPVPTQIKTVIILEQDYRDLLVNKTLAAKTGKNRKLTKKDIELIEERIAAHRPIPRPTPTVVTLQHVPRPPQPEKTSGPKVEVVDTGN
jgi:hypothetical protein